MKPKFKVNTKKRKKKRIKKLVKPLTEQPGFMYIMHIKWVSLEELRKLYGNKS